MSPLKLAASLLLPLGLVVAAACSSSPSASASGADCRENPASCKTGETCWPTNASTFACLPSQAGISVGSPCKETPGQTTCSDQMLCDATSASGAGTCTWYCGTGGHTCQDGYACVTTTVAGGSGSMSICRGEQSAPPPGTIYVDGGTFGTDGSAYDASIPVPPGSGGTDASQSQM